MGEDGVFRFRDETVDNNLGLFGGIRASTVITDDPDSVGEGDRDETMNPSFVVEHVCSGEER